MSEKTGVKYKIWLKGIYQCIHKWLTPCIKQGSTHCNINFIRFLIHLIPLHILNCFSISRHFKSYYSCSNISDTALSDTMKCNVENVLNLYRSTDHGIYFHEMPRTAFISMKCPDRGPTDTWVASLPQFHSPPPPPFPAYIVIHYTLCKSYHVQIFLWLSPIMQILANLPYIFKPW